MIETLKFQIAQLMKGQSTERQAQIAELRKKLVNAAQEANELRYVVTYVVPLSYMWLH